jgi:PIN domain nuclease of toxin-antitoxin system
MCIRDSQNFHKDPADQLIAATSISKNIPLLTFDKKLIEYKDLNIVTV